MIIPQCALLVRPKGSLNLQEKALVKRILTQMTEIKVHKLILNIPFGETGYRRTRAAFVLEQVSGQAPVYSKAKNVYRAFAGRRNDKNTEKRTCYVTVRGDRAMQLLDSGLRVKEYELSKRNFTDTGSFGFNIQEHIDLGDEYDPSTGICSINFNVVLERAGYRFGTQHKVTKDDAMKWFKMNYEGAIHN